MSCAYCTSALVANKRIHRGNGVNWSHQQSILETG